MPASRPHPGASPSAPAPTTDITRDHLLRGQVTLLQPRQGFRSSLDPVLLAGFLAPPYGHLLDIGCGTGALAFLLLARDPAASGIGVEIQPRLAELSRRGVVENRYGARFTIAEGDIRAIDFGGALFDLVASNPPFQPLGQGKLPPDPERAMAHHEVGLGLADWIARAAASCRPGGRVAVVFPASRAHELTAGLVARQLAPVRLRPVYPRAGQPASRVLVEALKVPGARPLQIEPPLLLHEEGGYTREVRDYLGEDNDRHGTHARGDSEGDIPSRSPA